MAKEHKTLSKKQKILIVVAIILVIASIGGVAIYIKLQQGKDKPTSSTNTEVESQQEPEVIPEEPPKEVQIFKGNDRPIAVMIDNHKGAWPQAGLNNAYIVYEIIVEGGETRLMAVFKGQNISNIGPVRSSRHYFLDYALENDAIYVHYGWSPQAQSDISTYKVNNINGISESSSSFWRTKKKSSPHNVLTSTEKILTIANRKKYNTTSTKESVLNYVADNIELTEGMNATDINIPYSNLQTVQYKYNAETGRYTRYARNSLQTDFETGAEVTTKNIIITFCENYTLDDPEKKGRQGLYNEGVLKGYYITNGKAVEITCTKKSRTSQTVYKDLNGKEIEVNDGNTFINICPTDAKVSIQ
ncbi:MAG: DUF3048 domain-containing protein [Clostridia bacterium]|nr:DUF3048 domain-containing protein [Clostridia bacterium]